MGLRTDQYFMISSLESMLKKVSNYTAHFQRDIFEYIESWYNIKRIHSAINYMTQQKEEIELKKAA